MHMMLITSARMTIILMQILYPKFRLTPKNNEDPDENNAAFHQGLHCLR